MTEHIDHADSFRKVLDSHGYGFQYAVFERARALAYKKTSPWLHEASEFPVPPDAKIDFLLRHSEYPRLLVAECKRVNPALGSWCFARAPYIARNVDELEPVVLEVVVRRDAQSAHVKHERLTYVRDRYHIGVEVRAQGKQGDRDGRRGAIEAAVTQVLRGTVGLAATLAVHPRLIHDPNGVQLLPVVFTTASLWVTDAKLNEATLESGELNHEGFQAWEVPWLTYQYNMTSSLRGEAAIAVEQGSFTDALAAWHTRSVIICGPTGIDEVLSRHHWAGS